MTFHRSQFMFNIITKHFYSSLIYPFDFCNFLRKSYLGSNMAEEKFAIRKLFRHDWKKG